MSSLSLYVLYHVAVNAYISTVQHDNITGIPWEEQRRE